MLGKHLLFISVDIANSTEMKQNIFIPGLTSKWMDVIDNTFSVIENAFSGVNDELKKNKFEAELNVWKFLGDELVYITEYSSVNELKEILELCVKHIKNISNYALKPKENKENSLNLDRLYFSAWTMFVDSKRCRTTGFAQNNIHKTDSTPSDIPLHPPSCDYNSPSMDIGFRLSQNKKIGRIFLSVELAYQLSVGYSDKCKKDNCKRKKDNCKCKNNLIYIHEAEGKAMKGVLGGNIYPRYWVDIGEEKILGGKRLSNNIDFQSCIQASRIADDCLGIINRFADVLYDPFEDSGNHIINRVRLKEAGATVTDNYLTQKMKGSEDYMSMEQNQNEQKDPDYEMPRNIKDYI